MFLFLLRKGNPHLRAILQVTFKDNISSVKKRLSDLKMWTKQSKQAFRNA